jgi:hypothetical protein
MQNMKSDTNIQISTLSDKINDGIRLINSMQPWYTMMDKQKVNYHMIAVSYDAENLMDEISSKYDTIIKAVLHQGSILNFISFHELKETISKITAKLPTDIEVEHRPSEKIQISFTEDSIIIHGFLNLKETSKFKLLAATSIPQKVKDDTFATTSTVSHLVAIDYNRQRYFNTTIGEMETCTKQQDNLHSCSMTSIHNLETNNNCIIDHLLNRNEYWACPIKQFVITAPIWKQLMMENTWLLVSSIPTRIATVCGGFREEKIVKSVAIIKIRNGCIIKTNDTTILSRRQSMLSVRGTFQKPINISVPREADEQTYYNATHILPIIKLEQSYVSDNIINEEPILKRHAVHHHLISISSSIFAVLMILLIWKLKGIVWNKFKSCCSRKSFEPELRAEPRAITTPVPIRRKWLDLRSSFKDISPSGKSDLEAGACSNGTKVN